MIAQFDSDFKKLHISTDELQPNDLDHKEATKHPISGDAVKQPINDEVEHEAALFDPPLYKQRYFTVAKLINEYGAKTVIDMGCSEGQFLTFVKDLCPDVEEINGIDIDSELLERKKQLIKPAVSEYVIKRPKPLKISLLHGSISQPDIRFYDYDFISCIEVIEHLYDDILEKVPEAIFGVLKPKVVAMTTPNCEYNVLFKNFSGMRHWDHKFEWTRQEFQNWCKKIETKYNYKLEFSGIGEPPLENQNVGHCSQMVLFIRDDKQTLVTVSKNSSETGSYRLIQESVYPFDDMNENINERLLNEVYYIISHFYYIDLLENDTTETENIKSTEVKKTFTETESHTGFTNNENLREFITTEVTLEDSQSEVITTEATIGDSQSEEEYTTQEIKISELLTYPGIKKLKLAENEIINILKEKYELVKNDEYLISKVYLENDFMDKWSGDEEIDYNKDECLNEIDNDFFNVEEDWD